MKRRIHSEKLRKWRARKGRIVKSISRVRRPRVTVYRSGKHIYAQLVDADSGRTLGAVSSRSREIVPEGHTGNVEAARRVGAALAELARRHEIEQVVFNRNGFLYHGRVRALAEAAREAGLRF